MQNYALFFKYAIVLTQTCIMHYFLINYTLIYVFLFRYLTL